MKKLLNQNFSASDQEQYVAVTKFKLGNDKPSILLQKLKSLFYGKPPDGIFIKILHSLFLQALPSDIRLYQFGDIPQKADAIYAELKYNIQSPVASHTTSPNLQFYEMAPYQESKSYSFNTGHSAVN